MKHRRIVIVVVVFLITTGFLLLLQFSPFSHLDWRNVASNFSSTRSTVPLTTAIAKENALLGTKKWQDNLNKGFSVFIQAYANTTSVAPNRQIAFYVSTLDPGTRYTISWYRLGWYGGDGARLMLSTNFLLGHAQGYYDSSKHVLVNCHTCHVNLTTGLVDANWQSSYVLKVPADWTTGVYLAKFTDEYRNTTVVPFDVQGNAHAHYVVVTPDTTYQAYNSWGGFSLFTANSNDVRHSIQVSFNRPYMASVDTNQLFDSELDAIRWMEMQGYDLSYISAVDLHKHPRLLMDHQAYISLGEDTFWTKEMRDGLEYARDHGVGLAFLGAGTGVWQMRFDPDRNGKADRTIVSYRVTSTSHNLQFDPTYGRDNSRVTTQWRDPLLARPENALLGVMFSDSTTHPTNFNWHTNSHLPTDLLASTGLQGNKNYGCGLVGNVWDRIYDNGATPHGLSVLSTSKTFNNRNEPDVSNTTYYIAPSGALVFAAGSLYWSRGLDAYRFHQDPQCPAQASAVPELQRLMANVMSALIVHHRQPHVAQALPSSAPFALNTSNGQSQGGFLGTHNGSLPVNQSAAQKAQSQTAANQQKTSHSSADDSSESNHGKQTKQPSQQSLPYNHASPGSFRGGRHGFRVSPDLITPRRHFSAHITTHEQHLLRDLLSRFARAASKKVLPH
ncbi:MAG TPA: N,N-dimethylformamidase beta subunit family domain-containing protein [Ktedonobacteraceae bacterium]|nr:N,N-dimethylformamidase beta subunit family domain-containing protein [Ktedonobacteraceae bacterium]